MLLIAVAIPTLRLLWIEPRESKVNTAAIAPRDEMHAQAARGVSSEVNKFTRLDTYARIFKPSSGLILGVGGTDHEVESSPQTPMIARTASVSLVARDFDHARGVIETIVRQHHGYVGELTANAPSGGGLTLTARLHIPVAELDTALVEIKKLGRVEQESEGGDEVTQQDVDLRARLANARISEQRLQDLLRQRTGKLEDVLAVEQELSRVREQIERMNAELKNLEHRVDFATVQVEIDEIYKANLLFSPIVSRKPSFMA